MRRCYLSYRDVYQTLIEAGCEDLAEQVREVFGGINDPYIFKAVFTAGGPGSGKTWVAGHMFSGLGLKFVGSDFAFEHLLRKRGMSLDLDMENPDYQEARKASKALTKLMKDKWINGMLGLIIDGTGKDYRKIKDAAKGLQDIGYDTGMVFVNTTLNVALERNKDRERTLPEDVVIDKWHMVQNNMGKFQSFFGKNNFFLVDNSEVLDKQGAQRLGKSLRSAALDFLSKPLRNPRGKKIVRALEETGGKTLEDLRDSIIEKAA